MSGVVKVQSGCPTWLRLSALKYHFATQCIPTPLAFHARHAPAVLGQLGTAATLWLQVRGRGRERQAPRGTPSHARARS